MKETSAKGITVFTSDATMVREAVFFSFDDVLIPFTYNLKLTMVPPDKYPGNPVVRRGGPGAPDDFGVQFYGSIIRHDDTFKLWYVAANEDINSEESFTMGWRQAYAESKDGINWDKPSRGLVEYNGNRDNNLLLIQPAPLATINLKVIFDPDDPDPSRRYKMAGHTWDWVGNRRGRATLCPLFSEDGLRWAVAGNRTPFKRCLRSEDRFLPDHAFEAGSGLYLWKGMYYINGQGGDKHTTHMSGRKVSIFRSADFIHWSPTRTLGFAREGQYLEFPGGHGEESHEGVGVWHRGNVIIGLYGIWHGAPDWPERTIDLGFLISNDGLHYREPVTEYVFLKKGEDGEWDQGGLIQGQGFENVGDKTYVWYGAWDPRHHPYVPRGGVGLAVLDRDRFGYLSMWDGADEASFVTSSIKIDGSAVLSVNADNFSHDARLRIEILDEREQPVPGFSGDAAAVHTDPGFNVPVKWKRTDRIGELSQPVKLRFTFEGKGRDAIRIYAFYLTHRK